MPVNTSNQCLLLLQIRKSFRTGVGLATSFTCIYDLLSHLLHHSQGTTSDFGISHRKWGSYFAMDSIWCFQCPNKFSGSQCEGKKPGNLFFFFCVRCIFCQMWRTEKARESKETVIYGLLRVTSNCTIVHERYLGYNQKISGYILFALVFHFVQHWCLNASCCIHQFNSKLIYKMLTFFSRCIYSHKEAGMITVCNAVCSAGFYKMEPKLISVHITVWITRLMQCIMS